MPFGLSSPAALWNYYAAKQNYYIQIGGYGMYYMQQNPAQLPIPQFSSSMRVRIRVKRGGSVLYNYRFTTALQIVQKPAKSKYDLDRDVNFLKTSTLSKCILICSLRESISIVLMILS